MYDTYSDIWRLNKFPHEKKMDQTRLKASADDKLNVTKMMISVFDRVKKHCGKRRNCLYKQFLLFPQFFQKASFPDPSKGCHCVGKGQDITASIMSPGYVFTNHS